MIYYHTIDSPIGEITFAKSRKGICRILLSEEEESLFKWCQHHFPEEIITKSEKVFPLVKIELRKYFSGELKTFSFPLDLQTTPFRRNVLEHVYKIPYGQTASYKEIAIQIGNPGALRAVGGANAKNPLPIVIPCHRVIAHNGSLGGYGGRLDLKIKLLQLEGAL